MAKRGGSGGGRSAGGGDSAPTNVAADEPVPQMPADVERISMGAFEEFEFEVDGVGVSVSVFDSGDSKEVTFNVGGSLDRSDRSRSTTEKITSRVRDIIKAYAAESPEGSVFTASAWTADGFGTGRALAYARAGFSAPKRPGQEQQAIVRNGRLRPDIDPATQRSRIRSLLNRAARERGTASRREREIARTDQIATNRNQSTRRRPIDLGLDFD